MKLTAQNINNVLKLNTPAIIEVVPDGNLYPGPIRCALLSRAELKFDGMHLHIFVNGKTPISLDQGNYLLSKAFNAQYVIQSVSITHHGTDIRNEQHELCYHLIARQQITHNRVPDITPSHIITTLGLKKTDFDGIAHKFLNDGHSFTLYNSASITNLLKIKLVIEHSKISTGYHVAVRKTAKQNVEILFTRIIQDNDPKKLFNNRYIGAIFGLTKQYYHYIDVTNCPDIYGRKQYAFEIDVTKLVNAYQTGNWGFYEVLNHLLDIGKLGTSSQIGLGAESLYKFHSVYLNAIKQKLQDCYGSNYQVNILDNGTSYSIGIIDTKHTFVNESVYQKLKERIGLHEIPKVDMPKKITKDTIADVTHISSQFISNYTMTKSVNPLVMTTYSCSFEYGGFLSTNSYQDLVREWGEFYKIVYNERNGHGKAKHQISIDFTLKKHINPLVLLTFGPDLNLYQIKYIIDTYIIGDIEQDFLNVSGVENDEYQLAKTGRLDQCKLSTIAKFTKYFEG